MNKKKIFLITALIFTFYCGLNYNKVEAVNCPKVKTVKMKSGKAIKKYYNKKCQVKKKVITFKKQKTINKYTYFNNGKIKTISSTKFYKNSQKKYRVIKAKYSYNTLSNKKFRFKEKETKIYYEKNGKIKNYKKYIKSFFRKENIEKKDIKYKNGLITKKINKTYYISNKKWNIRGTDISNYKIINNKNVKYNRIYCVYNHSYNNKIRMIKFDYLNKIQYAYQYNKKYELKSNKNGNAFLEKTDGNKLLKYYYKYDDKGKLLLLKTEEITEFNWINIIPAT